MEEISRSINTQFKVQDNQIHNVEAALDAQSELIMQGGMKGRKDSSYTGNTGASDKRLQ